MDVSPTDLKAMPPMAAYSNGGGYTVSGQYASVSPVTASTSGWYSPSETNVQILQSGDIIRKLDPGWLFLFIFHLFISVCPEPLPSYFKC